MPRDQAHSSSSGAEQTVSSSSSSEEVGKVPPPRQGGENHSENQTHSAPSPNAEKDTTSPSAVALASAAGGTDRGALTSKGQLVSLMRGKDVESAK